MNHNLYFLHGNGFPSGCYRQILQPFQQNYRLYYYDKVGHKSSFPVTDNWPHLVREVCQDIKKQVGDKPTIGIGHSLGGVLNFMASLKEPKLFSGLILLDSPLHGRLKSISIRALKRLNLIDFVTPASRSRGRKSSWNSRQDVETYLKSRSLYSSFDAQCLTNFIDYGMEQDRVGDFKLSYDPEVEYQIYRTLPDNLYRYASLHKVPTYLIYGDKSHLISRYERKVMTNQFHINCIKTKGSHMFPFEYPELTVRKIEYALQELNRL